MHTYYEFFAGAGMARAGLGAEWQCLFANDISAKKADAYSANWGAADLVIADVFSLSADHLPGHVDMAWGSFPCQDLSLAGAGGGLAGARSSAFWGFWQLIRELDRQSRKPRTVVLENVLGALTSHCGRDFDHIVQALQSQGYIVGALVIDAVHFTPQSRPRLFVVGVDSELFIPRFLQSEQPNPAWHPDAVIRGFHRLSQQGRSAWRWWNLSLPNKRVGTLEDLIEAQPSGVDWHTQTETNYLLAMMSDVNRRKVLQAQRAGMVKVGTIYRRTRDGAQRAEVRFDGIAGCLRTPTGGSSRQTIMVIDGPRVRSRLISPREAARLMGLPESYQLPQRYNDSYHLLGDGVVVPVVAHLREHLLEPILRSTRLEIRVA